MSTELTADLVRRLVGGRDEVEPGARDQVQPHVLPRQCEGVCVREREIARERESACVCVCV